MKVHEKPVRVMLPDPATGDESHVAVAHILMDDAGDMLRTNGYYWARESVHGDSRDPETWKQAVFEARGPFESVDNAFTAAEIAAMDVFDVANRLEACAIAVRCGLVDSNLKEILQYMQIAMDIDKKKRDEKGDSTRTAAGHHAEENQAATKEAVDNMEMREYGGWGADTMVKAGLMKPPDPDRPWSPVTEEDMDELRSELKEILAEEPMTPMVKAFLEDGERELQENLEKHKDEIERDRRLHEEHLARQAAREKSESESETTVPEHSTGEGAQPKHGDAS